MKQFEETELNRLIAGCKERITLFDTEIKNIKDRKQKYDPYDHHTFQYS